MAAEKKEEDTAFCSFLFLVLWRTEIPSHRIVPRTGTKQKGGGSVCLASVADTTGGVRRATTT
jgi:hypothetical protein